MRALALSIFFCVAAASSSRRCFSAMAASNCAFILSRASCTSLRFASAAPFSFIATLSSASAARRARCLGSTILATSWYVFIALHQSQRPATEPDAFCAASKVKSDERKYGISSSHVSSLMRSLGNVMREFRKPMSDIIFLETSKKFSSELTTMHSLPWVHDTLFMGRILRSTTQSKMRVTSSGGFASAFRFWMSVGLMADRAWVAASSAGCAAARSFSASAFSLEISSALAVTASTITCTFCASLVAMAVDSVISVSRAADTRCASARSAFLMASSPFIFATSCFASKSFSRPELILSASTRVSESLRP
mmetsp:Transcript_18328/g.62275  ORF Transcript_18328/g.62275 Transcript_18328/m.62275 type:complete len:310 (+) Transcript_18328:1828-2757(+)